MTEYTVTQKIDMLRLKHSSQPKDLVEHTVELLENGLIDYLPDLDVIKVTDAWMQSIIRAMERALNDRR